MSRFTRVVEFGDMRLYDGDKAVDGFAEEILLALQRQLLTAVERHSQVLVALLTVNFPKEVEATSATPNACFQRFIQAYARRLGSQGFAPQYIWVRESGDSGQLHYHLALLLDGNAIRYYRSPTEANAYWTAALQRKYGIECPCCINLADFGGSHSMLVRRGDSAAYTEAMLRLSYLAKCYSKQAIGTGIRCWSQSQL